MSETKKAVLVVVLIVAAITDALVWTAPPRDIPAVWGWRIGLALLAIGSVALLLWGFLRKSAAPEFLQSLAGKPFDRNGVSFLVMPSVSNGVAYLNIPFENRWSMPCEFRVCILGPAKFFSAGAEHFPGVDVVVPCAGGMLGLIRAPIAIPAAFHNRKITFRVTAEVRYAKGHGQLLRYREGLGVRNPPGSRSAETGFRILALLAGFIICYKTDAKATMRFLTSPAEEIPEGLEPTVETLWMPGEPEEGVVDRLNLSMATQILSNKAR